MRRKKAEIFRLNSLDILILPILLLATFLRTEKITEYMTFIGDQGWFYVSARDLIFSGQIPLVGIASSHPWLHQGPLWTYMLAPVLPVLNFDPIAGAFLTAFLDAIAVFVVYKIGLDFFSRRIGLIAAVIYAVSPAMVFYSRMPYHTSPIPLFVFLLTYAMLAWVVQEKAKFFPLVILFIFALYNLELATIVLFFPIFVYFFLGFYKKKKFFKTLLNVRIAFAALACFVLMMAPVLLYDFRNGFPQTVKFGAWIIYKIVQGLGFLPRNTLDQNTYLSVLAFLLEKYYQLLLPVVGVFSIVFLLLIFVYSVRNLISNYLSSTSVVSFLFLISFAGYIVAKTPSEAYLPMIFPLIVLLFAILVASLKNNYAIGALVTIIIFLNVNFIRENYEKINGRLENRINVAKEVIRLSSGREYNLVFRGSGEEFPNTIKNYEYLTWWLSRNPPSFREQDTKILITENGNKTTVSRVK